ncbi:MAG: GAF domain-containing protein, partial [Rhodothermales bacterium]|nr:GAF domain-containing protein [Rhodothermales bacterium]
MINGLFTPSLLGSTMFGAGQRLQTWLLALTAFVACALAAAYHVMAMTESAPDGRATRFVYHALVLFGYSVIYLFLSGRLRRRSPTSLRVFWLPILTGIFFLAIHYGLTSIAKPPELPSIAASAVAFGFEYGTGRPLVPATVFNMNVISLLAAVFAFILLLRFRDLVLVKRTKASQRNWYLMLGFMAFASLLTFMTPANEFLNIWQRLAMVPAIGFMVVNSLRLSWIVFLSFSEKLMSIGMSLFLLLILGGVGIMETGGASAAFELPLPYIFIKHYSYPLSVFVSLTVIFGILYCTTALLSLIFHLPTTSDYQQRVGELAAMHSLTNLVGQVFDSERLFSMIVSSPVETGAGSAAWLSIPDRSSPSLLPRVVAGHRIDLERASKLVDISLIYEEVAETREPVLLQQAAADHRVTAKPGEGIGSLLSVPLLARDELLGALFVTKEVSHGFERDDV